MELNSFSIGSDGFSWSISGETVPGGNVPNVHNSRLLFTKDAAEDASKLADEAVASEKCFFTCLGQKSEFHAEQKIRSVIEMAAMSFNYGIQRRGDSSPKIFVTRDMVALARDVLREYSTGGGISYYEASNAADEMWDILKNKQSDAYYWSYNYVSCEPDQEHMWGPEQVANNIEYYKCHFNVKK